MKSEVNKVLFIINRFAGTGYRPELEGKIIDYCQKKNLEFNLEFTASRGHATQLAKAAVDQKNHDVVVAVGGDGTVNEVAQGLLRSEIPMAIIPKGSGNGLARHLKIPMNTSAALESMSSSQVIAMDTFTLNGRLSLNVSGIGFDGHIANIFGTEKKRGLRGYAKHAINQFITFKEFEANIKTGNESYTRNAFVIAIANSSQYGNNARIAPAASVCDQLLHLCILKKVPPYRVDFIYSFFKGKISESSFCEFFETSEVKITLKEAVAYHVDGEPCGHDKNFDIRLQASSLPILVPEKTMRP